MRFEVLFLAAFVVDSEVKLCFRKSLYASTEF